MHDEHITQLLVHQAPTFVWLSQWRKHMVWPKKTLVLSI